MYLVKTPSFVKPLARDLLWHVKTDRREVFLTFDDGPTPGVTEDVLNLLERFQAKATFFCLGKNAEQFPELYAQLIEAGHAVGNHSYSHPDGWKTGQTKYLRDVVLASRCINSNLFRPPYGHITPAQVNAIKKKYTIVMWDVLSADFDAAKSPEQCLEHVCRHTGPGSIVVFHDSVKARKNMLFALEGSLEYLAGQGYILRSLSSL